MISLLVANYNNGRFLDEFFQSVLTSKVKPKTIVFVDDGSTDNSIDIVNNYKKYLNIDLVELDRNVGFSNALNIGMSRCFEKYIVRVDPDDILEPDRLEKQLAFMEAHDDLAVVGSQAIYFDSISGKSVATTNKPISHDDIFKAYLRGDNGVIHGTTMIRADIFKRYSYAQEEVPSEDYGMFSRIIASGAIFHNLPDGLTRVRVHVDSVSNNIKYSTIEKVFELRRQVFGVRYNFLSVFREYVVIYSYRKALFSSGLSKKAFYAAVACFFGPERALRRLIDYIGRWYENN